MILGGPVSDRFLIGTCELRVAPLNTVRGYNPKSEIDLLSEAGWTLPQGWSMMASDLFRHMPGNTDELSHQQVFSNSDLGKPFRAVYNISARSAGSVDIEVGGRSFTSLTSSGVENNTVGAADGVKIIPTSTFDGRVTVKLYDMTPGDDNWLLSPEHSIGLFDNVVLTVGHTVTRSNAGFPRIAHQDKASFAQMRLTGRLREYTKNNLSLLAGKGPTQTSETVLLGAIPSSRLFTVELVSTREDSDTLKYIKVYHDIWKAEITSDSPIPMSPTEFSGSDITISSIPITMEDYYMSGCPLYYFRSRVAAAPVGRLNYVPPA